MTKKTFRLLLGPLLLQAVFACRLAAELPEAELLKLLRLLLVSIHRDAARAGSETENDPDLDSHAAPVY